MQVNVSSHKDTSKRVCLCRGVWGLGVVMLIFRINCVFMSVTVTPSEVGQLGTDNN